MKKAIVVSLIVFALTLTLSAQTSSTTNTTCTRSGDYINCNGTTTTTAPPDNSAQIARQQAQDQANYQAGQAVGAAMGSGIAAAIRVHQYHKSIKKYCKHHQGEQWFYRNPQGQVLDSGQCN